VASVISDVEFLAEQAFELGDHIIYFYGADSGFLKPRVRERVEDLAHERGWMPVSLGEGSLWAAITSPSLLDDPPLIVCDLAEIPARSSAREDVEVSLGAIAAGSLDNHVLLMVPDNSFVVKSSAWQSATTNATYLEEPMVTRDNLKSILPRLAAMSDLGDLSKLAKRKDFIAPLKQFLAERDGTIREIMQRIDEVVLVEMGSGLLPDSPQHPTARHDLSKSLITFLDKRDARSLYALLRLIDELRCKRMLEVADVLVRLYEATASIVGGKDQRYKRNKTGNPAVWEYVVWGSLLLAWERRLVEGGFFLAFDRLCRDFMNVDNYQGWPQRTDQWQEILTQFVRSRNEESGKVTRARASLVNALQGRLGALQNEAGSGWIYQIIQDAASADQPPLT
jgi:hypothetical protein